MTEQKKPQAAEIAMPYKEGMHVYFAIASITEALSKDGISKSRKNAMQGYQFRGIDDIYNALAPELAKNKLCVLPEVLEREVVERQTQKGGALFYTTVKVRFDFVSAVDGSKHSVFTFGEAMDSGDKATNKAMSAAYKYAALMAFCIPTEGDNDTENQTHEVKPETDLQKFAKDYAAEISLADTTEKLNALVTRNSRDMARLSDALPQWHGKLLKLLDDQRAKNGGQNA